MAVSAVLGLPCRRRILALQRQVAETTAELEALRQRVAADEVRLGVPQHEAACFAVTCAEGP
jgi:hypothetical protein